MNIIIGKKKTKNKKKDQKIHIQFCNKLKTKVLMIKRLKKQRMILNLSGSNGILKKQNSKMKQILYNLKSMRGNLNQIKYKINLEGSRKRTK